MAKHTSARTPSYRRQRGEAGDRAFVEIEGRRTYLGAYGSPESKGEYGRVIAEWAASGGRVPVAADEITIVEMVARFLAHVETYYRRADGTPSTEVAHFKRAMRPLCKLYGRTPAASFGPLALKAVRKLWVDQCVARSYVNANTDRIRRLFKWAASDELVPASVWHSLQTVAGLKRGRTAAHETDAVGPVSDHAVDLTIPFLTSVVRGMVEVQRLTGMRPAEVCALRGCDLDMAGAIWTYRPKDHKTAYRGRTRTIFIGPRAQEVLRRFLRRKLAAFLFSAATSAAEHVDERHRGRKTPMSCGNRPGTNRKQRPRRKPRDHFDAGSYRQAIQRACDRAFPASAGTSGDALKAWRKAHRWAPNRLRHAYGTEVRREHGLEAAQILLGHAKADVTQVYAERDVAKALAVAAKIG